MNARKGKKLAPLLANATQKEKKNGRRKCACSGSNPALQQRITAMQQGNGEISRRRRQIPVPQRLYVQGSCTFPSHKPKRMGIRHKNKLLEPSDAFLSLSQRHQ